MPGHPPADVRAASTWTCKILAPWTSALPVNLPIQLALHWGKGHTKTPPIQDRRRNSFRLVAKCQAKLTVAPCLRFALRIAAPMKPKPKSIIIQVAGSGTADMNLMLSVSKAALLDEKATP